MYRNDVERKLGVSGEQLNHVIKVMEKYHYFENWIWYRLEPTDLIVFFNLELVDWLKEVYFNKNGFFLDREIYFLNARILDMENELNISHFEKVYPYLNIKELQKYFNKSNSSILKAIERMNKKTDCKCYREGKLYITPIGVKWLDQNYYRKSYIKELLNYKKILNEKENKNEYKLPGGGSENNESPEETFIREVLEETGCDVDIIEKLGITEEYKCKTNFKQISNIFVGMVKKDNNNLNLTQQEEDEGGKLLWVTPEEGLSLITNCYNKIVASAYEDIYITRFVVLRDRKILEYYLNIKNSN